MALYAIILFFLCSVVYAENIDPKMHNQILYTIQTGDFKRAFEIYEEHKKLLGHHDLELLQQMGILILDRGNQSHDPETKLLTLFGAGISTHERTLYILEDAIASDIPPLQLVAMNLLSRFQNDHADESMNRALSSNNLLIRMEALYHLAALKHPKAASQIEALMSKVPEAALPLFPPLYALLGNAESAKILRRMLIHPNREVRLAAILSCAKFGRDDMLPQIRSIALQHDRGQQEACAAALGILKDEASIPRLETLAKSPAPNVRLAALQALHRLGKKGIRQSVEKEVKSGNVFAIAILGEMEGSEPLLHQLLETGNLQVRINACLALLQLQDPRCLPVLPDILIHDSRDLEFEKVTSLGLALNAWKAIPSARQNFDEDTVALELSHGMREETLRQCADLPEKDFLRVASALFENHQNDLIPTLVTLLQNLQTSDAINMLKKYQQKAGAPLIRNYCNLALYNLKEPGPYGDNLRAWITEQRDEDLIRFRPYIPWEARDGHSFVLTPHETSLLLVQAFESFARMQDGKGIDVILDAILHGNKKNQYAITGLLIRAAM